jgi:hypothetical protein
MRIRLLLLLTLAPTAAFADRRELYLEAAGGPAFVQLRALGAAGYAPAQAGPAATVSAYYGFTNAFHVGGGAYFATMRDIHVTGAQLSANDFTGDVWTDWIGAGLSAFALYRYDTGLPWAPFLRLELAAGVNRFSRLALIPDSLAYYEPSPDRWELAIGARAALGLEIRLSDRWAVNIAAALRAAAVGHSGISLEVPLAIAYVW